METKNQKTETSIRTVRFGSGSEKKTEPKKCCSDSECAHGRERYPNVNSSLNITFMTLTIHRSPINVSKGMNEVTCQKMLWAPSQGHMQMVNISYRTVENTRIRLILSPHTWSTTFFEEQKCLPSELRASWGKSYLSADYNTPRSDRPSCRGSEPSRELSFCCCKLVSCMATRLTDSPLPS